MQYVFLDDNYQTGHILMSDIENKDNVSVIYKDRLFDHHTLNNFCRFYISKKVKKFIKLPGRLFWYRNIFKKFDRDKSICIVMISAWYDADFLKWIKTYYKKCKLVMILRDTVESNEKRDRTFKIFKVSKEFDLVISYDKTHDVKKYNLAYAPVYMSKIKDLDVSGISTTDIVFIAVVKDRLPIIYNIYKRMIDSGIEAFFYLLGVSDRDKLKTSDIIYALDPMDRIECLKREITSNCILEILKGDAYSNTLRYWEAIIYNKKFLTNWSGVKESKYYNPKYIHYFESANDIDMNFIKEKILVDYHYNNELSPVHLIELINKKLVKSSN